MSEVIKVNHWENEPDNYEKNLQREENPKPVFQAYCLLHILQEYLIRHFT